MALGTLSRRLPQHGIEAPTTRNTALLALGADLPAPGAPRQPVGAVGPGGSRRYRTATFDVRTEKPRAEPLLLAPPDAVPVFDGVFLLRPQLNDAWDLRIFLEVSFQETLGCPTLDSRTSILG